MEALPITNLERNEWKPKNNMFIHRNRNEVFMYSRWSKKTFHYFSQEDQFINGSAEGIMIEWEGDLFKIGEHS